MALFAVSGAACGVAGCAGEGGDEDEREDENEDKEDEDEDIFL